MLCRLIYITEPIDIACLLFAHRDTKKGIDQGCQCADKMMSRKITIISKSQTALTSQLPANIFQ